jgi:hypothetical protein
MNDVKRALIDEMGTKKTDQLTAQASPAEALISQPFSADLKGDHLTVRLGGKSFSMERKN